MRKLLVGLALTIVPFSHALAQNLTPTFEDAYLTAITLVSEQPDDVADLQDMFAAQWGVQWEPQLVSPNLYEPPKPFDDEHFSTSKDLRGQDGYRAVCHRFGPKTRQGAIAAITSGEDVTQELGLGNVDVIMAIGFAEQVVPAHASSIQYCVFGFPLDQELNGEALSPKMIEDRLRVDFEQVLVTSGDTIAFKARSGPMLGKNVIVQTDGLLHLGPVLGGQPILEIRLVSYIPVSNS
jgi:hypothetical protein